MREESSRTVNAKPDDVEIWSRYDEAPKDVPQTMVGLVAIPVALSAGDVNAGTGGAAMIVVKEYVDEYELVPPEFLAFTLQ